MPPWDPEIEVDVERARALIGEQIPELADAEIRHLASGWDNTVFVVGDRWSFRFPRRKLAVPLIEREIETLPRLASNVPLPVPEPRWVGAPTHTYPWPWFGAPFLPGTELADAELPDDRREDVADAIGAFLRALHRPRLRSRIGPDMPHDPNRRADMPFRVAAARALVNELAEVGLWQAPPEVEALLADAERLPPSSRTAVLHGDLHIRHLLVDGTGRASGVIDWGDVCVGDPSIDLSVAYGAFAGSARGALLDAYGHRIDGVSELRARVIALFLGMALLGYADAVGHVVLRSEAARSMERAIT